MSSLTAMLARVYIKVRAWVHVHGKKRVENAEALIRVYVSVYVNP